MSDHNRMVCFALMASCFESGIYSFENYLKTNRLRVVLFPGARNDAAGFIVFGAPDDQGKFPGPGPLRSII
jgi:hypothetical protein